MSPKQKTFLSISAITGVATIVAVGITCVGIVWSASSDWTGVGNQIQELRATDADLKSTDDDHEARLRAVEAIVTETHTIVQRIDARVMMIHP